MNMNFEILSLDERKQWSAYLAKIPDGSKSPYFKPEYYHLFEKWGEGKSICFVGTEQDKVVLYPTLKNSINGLGYELDDNYYDIQGAYGYNGPVTNSNDCKFLKDFSNAILDYCTHKKIVTEFIRFCPIIGNYNKLLHVKASHEMENVLIDLTEGMESIWRNSFDNGVRKAVKKAMKAGLGFISLYGDEIAEEELGVFIQIYNATMRRNQASENYYFPNSFFLDLFFSMPQDALISFATLEGKAISTELVILNKENAYGFLGGTLSEYYKLSPNSYLRYELIRYLIESGVKTYSIGGGKPGDSIYKFKKSFSKDRESKFYIGKYIHNENVYNEIVAQWSERFPEKVDSCKNYFLKYRF